MRKVTQQIATAFKAGQSASVGNTMTDGDSVYLHGNKIATINHGKLMVSLAGWNTVTTRERINGLLETFGFAQRFGQKDFEPVIRNAGHQYLVHIDEREWYGFTL